MDNKHADEIDALVKRYTERKRVIVGQTLGIALAFFKQSFINGGFTDKSLKKWPKRKGGARNDGRALLVDRAVLKRGLRIKQVDSNGGIIGVDEGIKYAEIHNQGGDIPLTPKMRRFFWAMYFKHGGGDKKLRKSKLAQFYLGLAISKKDSITIPQRQFIGDSKTLEKKLYNYIEGELIKIFNV